jgi:hypothetical protein
LARGALLQYRAWTSATRAIEAGLKTIEVRSPNTRYRGPLVICTSRRLADSRSMTKADEAAAGVAWRPGALALRTPRRTVRR